MTVLQGLVPASLSYGLALLWHIRHRPEHACVVLWCFEQQPLLNGTAAHRRACPFLQVREALLAVGNRKDAHAQDLSTPQFAAFQDRKLQQQAFSQL
jgi:hypothetical protein